MEEVNATDDLGGLLLKVATMQYQPFIIRHQNGAYTWYTGLCMDLLDILANALNFTYTVTEPADQMFGLQLPNGTWAGLTGMLERKEADVALTGLSVTADRAAVSDHTIGFYHDSVALISTLPNPSPAGWTFLIRPLHWHLYLLLGCCLAVMTCAFVWTEKRYMVKRREKGGDGCRVESYVDPTSVMRAAEVLPGTLFGRAVSFRAASNSGRILQCAWSLLSVVMIATYTSKLTSNSVVTRQPLPFNSLSELVKRSDYRWAFPGGTMIETIFATSSNKDYQRFYRKTMEFAADDPGIMTTTLSTSLADLLEGNFVIATALSYARPLQYEDCRVTVAKERLLHDTLAIHLQKSSPYTDMFNRVLFRLKEMGILERLDRKWFFENAGCDLDQTRVVPVSLELVQTAFVMAGCGLVVAAIFLPLEWFADRLHQNQSDRRQRLVWCLY